MKRVICYCVATILNVFLNTALFVKLDPETFENKPVLGSVIFYLTVLGKLWHRKLIPNHWKTVPCWGLLILETLFALLMGEFAMSLLWLPVENMIVYMVHYILMVGVFSEAVQSFCAEVCTAIVAIAFMILVLKITVGHCNILQIISEVLPRKETKPSRRRPSMLELEVLRLNRLNPGLFWKTDNSLYLR